ncbi:hypothetical protein Ae201684P_003061 [Aphanomyces euteiches]|nr:hypothetical protein Ae201684P_003061 [Aphanomyces euteiches]
MWRQISTRVHRGPWKGSHASKRGISYVLGIETSCDDTAAAVVDSDGNVLSEVVSSQWEMIQKWKGVVPALAARGHVENLPLVLDEAMRQSGLDGYKSLSAIAVTSGPGLAPCLNVGLRSAVEIAVGNDLDFISVNHLEAHALVPRIAEDLPFPFLVLLVSGGHCTLVLAKDLGDYDVLGSTVDDSVGEAFDKVARMLELGNENTAFHGGKLVEEYAKLGNDRAFAFTEPMKKKQRKDCDFSYSGLKTAMVRHISQLEKPLDEATKRDLAASFQRTAIAHLVTRTKLACEISKETTNIQHLVVCGGVAANTQVRHQLEALAKAQGLQAMFPPIR